MFYIRLLEKSRGFSFNLFAAYNLGMGKESQEQGRAFEEYFSDSCKRQGFVSIKLPLGAIVYGSTSFGKPKFRLAKSPFDFIVGGQIGGHAVAAYIDCKTNQGATFPRSLIDWKQVENLELFSRFGHPSGYLVHFRKLEQIYFFSVKQLMSCEGSLKPEHGVLLGGLFDMSIKSLWKK